MTFCIIFRSLLNTSVVKPQPYPEDGFVYGCEETELSDGISEDAVLPDKMSENENFSSIDSDDVTDDEYDIPLLRHKRKRHAIIDNSSDTS